MDLHGKLSAPARPNLNSRAGRVERDALLRQAHPILTQVNDDNESSMFAVSHGGSCLAPSMFFQGVARVEGPELLNKTRVVTRSLG